MSEENKAGGGAAENKAAPAGEDAAASGVPVNGDGYFESLIEDFDVSAPAEDVPKPGLKDFSRFFNDAAAFGGGFESTIDKDVNDQLTAEFPLGEGATLDFSGNMRESEVITTPVTDENGMIVIFDEEAGIDATSAIVPESVERFLADSSLSEEGSTEDGSKENSYIISEESETPDSEREAGVLETPENDYSADSNIGDEIEDNTISNALTAENERKRPFIAGLFPWAGDSAGEIIRKIIFLVSACVFIGAGIMLIGTLSDSEEAIKEQETLRSMITTTAVTSVNDLGETVTIPPTSEERISHAESLMNGFVEVSGNVKGILELPSLEINYPVVQGTDNEYYLTHTYDDRKNRAGAIFMDYRCTHTAEYTSPNLVLYGHNQNDGTMFGKLKVYKNNVDFYRHSPMIYFNTEFEAGDYVIFGYFISPVHEYQDSSGEIFHYHDYIETLNNESTFNWYMGMIQERNQIISPVDVKFGDRLLVLSTCSSEYNDSRFVVVARKLRDGESYSAFNFKVATLNPYAKQINWESVLAANTVPVINNSPALVSAVDGVPSKADGVLSEVYQKYKDSYGSMEEISDSNTDIQIIKEEAVSDDASVSEETAAAATAASAANVSETSAQMPTKTAADTSYDTSLSAETTVSADTSAVLSEDSQTEASSDSETLLKQSEESVT